LDIHISQSGTPAVLRWGARIYSVFIHNSSTEYGVERILKFGLGS